MKYFGLNDYEIQPRTLRMLKHVVSL